MTTIIELIEQASFDISKYKNPDINECQRKLSELVEAAGYGGLMNDQIESLEIDHDILHIETSWSARGCSNSSSYRIPMKLIRSEDPIKAVKIWGVEKQITKYEFELEDAKKNVTYKEEAIAKLKIELESIMS